MKLLTLAGNILLLFGLAMITSCASSAEKTNQSPQIPAEDYFTEDIARRIFRIESFIPVDLTKDSKTGVISRSWELSRGGDEIERYRVNFHFESSSQMSQASIDKAWENQNKKLYKDYKILQVDDIAKKASWTDYEGGELRVATDDNIYYITMSSSLSSNSETKEIWDSDFKLNHAMFLAQIMEVWRKHEEKKK